jgi:arylsulfatase A-like enzyme
LQAVPEGNGTMLDNTVIVYTSDFGERHHSTGYDWAYVLVGNAGGALKFNQYIDYPLNGKKGGRSINALYCTLLHAAGDKREHFNLDGSRKSIDEPGPLSELLA